MTKIAGGGFLKGAMEAAAPKIRAAVAAAVRDAATPPPPGMVKINISTVVSERLLEDDAALGAFLAAYAKRNLAR